jgi:hypothetical protein
VNEIPLDEIESLAMVIGESCRVASRVTSDGERTLTITRPDGIICCFKGQMEFTWVVPPA